MNDLETLQRRFGRFLIPLLWAHVVLVAAAEAVTSAAFPAIAPVVAAASLAALATAL